MEQGDACLEASGCLPWSFMMLQDLDDCCAVRSLNIIDFCSITPSIMCLEYSVRSCRSCCSSNWHSGTRNLRGPVESPCPARPVLAGKLERQHWHLLPVGATVGLISNLVPGAGTSEISVTGISLKDVSHRHTIRLKNTLGCWEYVEIQSLHLFNSIHFTSTMFFMFFLWFFGAAVLIADGMLHVTRNGIPWRPWKSWMLHLEAPGCAW